MESRPTRTGGSWLTRRARSFVCAARGLWLQVATEPNARIHLVATVLAFALSAWLQLSALEWCAIVAAAALVWIAEGLNSALEALADHVATERHPLIGRAKDVAAGAVLVASIAAAAIGLIVLGPKLWLRLHP
jgi:diacylglycerol kinase (ATP)